MQCYGMVSHGTNPEDFIWVTGMNEKLQQAYFYDFYGELLNEHQRRIYEAFHFNDLSLGEIAEQENISRQAVADMVKRCERKLKEYERKLHLVERFLFIKKNVEQIRMLADGLYRSQDMESIDRIKRISNQILEEL